MQQGGHSIVKKSLFTFEIDFKQGTEKYEKATGR